LHEEQKKIDGSPFKAGKIKFEDENPPSRERRSLLELASEKHVN